MKKRHLRNCHTCGHNKTTVFVDGDGFHGISWCQPYQDDWISDDPAIPVDGVISWTEKVGLDDKNMPPKRTFIACPTWVKK